MFPKLKKNNFLTGSLVYLASNILNASIPFLLIPVLTRYLGAEGYGQVGMFQTVVSLLAAFVGLNVFGVINRKYYEYGERQSQYLREFMASCLQILLASAIVILSIAVLFMDHASELTGLEANWIVAAVFVAVFTKAIQARLIQWQIRKRSTSYAVFQVLLSLTNLSLSILLVAGLSWGVEGRISAQLIAFFVFFLLALYFLQKDSLLKFLVWRPEYIKEAVSYGVPLIPHVAGIFLLNLVDRFVVNDQLGTEKVGIYMVAVQLTMVMSIVFDAINKAYVPWLFERLDRNHPQEKIMIVKYTYLWFLVIGVAVFLAFVIGPLLVPIIAGQEFREAGELVGWLAVGQGFGGAYLMVTNYIHFSKRTGLLSLVTIVSGALNCILLFVLVQSNGLLGAAQAFSIAMALRFFLTWLVAQKRHSMPWFGNKEGA